MGSRYLFLVCVFFSLSFFSCGETSESLDIADRLRKSSDLNGKDIILDGYIYTDKIDFRNSDVVTVKLHSLPIATKGNLLTSNICLFIGDTVNCLKMPKSKHYKPNDLLVIDSEMNELKQGSKVRVKGHVVYTAADDEDFQYKIENVVLTKL